MNEARHWFICRVGYVEVWRALSAIAGSKACDSFEREWPLFGVIEPTADQCQSAAPLTTAHDLRSLDAIHVAAGLALNRPSLLFASWDKRQRAAAEALGLALFPNRLP